MNKEGSMSEGNGFTSRVPLKEVVAECVQRWFDATLKEAEHGNDVMQFLVGQMYCSGYGVPCDVGKAEIWIKKSGATDAEARNLIKALTDDLSDSHDKSQHS